MGKKIKKEKKERSAFVGGLITLIVSIVIVVASAGGLIFYLIKNNINNVATNNEEYIRKIPIINLALPEVEDSEDIKYLSDKEIKEKYNDVIKEKVIYENQIEEYKSKISELEEFKKKYEDAMIESIKVEEEKKILEEERKELVEKEKEINRLIGMNKTEDFKTYFESIDKNLAQEIYTQIIKQDSVDIKVKEYAKLYENMEPASAASIFQEMGNNERKEIVNTLKSLKKDVAAQILSEMEPSLAADLSKDLYDLFTNIDN